MDKPDEKKEEEVIETSPEAESEKKDRTSEQFEKLTSSNRQLKEEVERLKQAQYQQPVNQAPSAQAYSHLSQEQVNNVFQSMVDQDGYLDGNKLSAYLNSMNQRAIQAESKNKQLEQQVRELNTNYLKDKEKQAQEKVYQKYPQLNPEDKDKFDPKMHRAVYNALAAKATRGELPTDDDYLNAAEEVYNDFYKDQDMNKKDQEQLEKAEEQKAQSTFIRPRSSMDKNYYKDSEHEAIIQDVRAGKRGALAALLNKIGE